MKCSLVFVLICFNYCLSQSNTEIFIADDFKNCSEWKQEYVRNHVLNGGNDSLLVSTCFYTLFDEISSLSIVSKGDKFFVHPFDYLKYQRFNTRDAQDKILQKFQAGLEHFSRCKFYDSLSISGVYVDSLIEIDSAYFSISTELYSNNGQMCIRDLNEVDFFEYTEIEEINRYYRIVLRFQSGKINFPKNTLPEYTLFRTILFDPKSNKIISDQLTKIPW